MPDLLTIADGVVRWPAAHTGGTAEGSVNAQGVLVMHAPTGAPESTPRSTGRGNVTGRYTGFCGYHMVWQKEAK